MPVPDDRQATALINDHPVSFLTANDPDLAAPVAATMIASVGLAYEDLVAALYCWQGSSPAEMDQDEWVRQLVPNRWSTSVWPSWQT